MEKKKINNKLTIAILAVAIIFGLSFGYGMYRSKVNGRGYHEELLGDTCTCSGAIYNGYCYTTNLNIGDE